MSIRLQEYSTFQLQRPYPWKSPQVKNQVEMLNQILSQHLKNIFADESHSQPKFLNTGWPNPTFFHLERAGEERVTERFVFGFLL